MAVLCEGSKQVNRQCCGAEEAGAKEEGKSRYSAGGVFWFSHAQDLDDGPLEMAGKAKGARPGLVVRAVNTVTSLRGLTSGDPASASTHAGKCVWWCAIDAASCCEMHPIARGVSWRWTGQQKREEKMLLLQREQEWEGWRVCAGLLASFFLVDDHTLDCRVEVALQCNDQGDWLDRRGRWQQLPASLDHTPLLIDHGAIAADVYNNINRSYRARQRAIRNPRHPPTQIDLAAAFDQLRAEKPILLA
ncbi:hypothetical protein Q7P37_000806 [Cladosporium fusiforme]